jgi:hypothetical protein
MNKMGVTSPSGIMRVLAEHIHIYPTFLIPFIPFIPVNPNRHKKARLRSVVGDGRIAGVLRQESACCSGRERATRDGNRRRPHNSRNNSSFAA